MKRGIGGHLAGERNRKDARWNPMSFAGTKKPPSKRRLLKWSGRRDSNARRPPWQGGALPTELRPQSRVQGVGAEERASTGIFAARSHPKVERTSGPLGRSSGGLKFALLSPSGPARAERDGPSPRWLTRRRNARFARCCAAGICRRRHHCNTRSCSCSSRNRRRRSTAPG